MSTQFAHWSGSGHIQSSLAPVEDVDEDSALAPLKKTAALPPTKLAPPPVVDSYSSLHRHRDSVSSNASDSATSSPTTTASLVDSHSVGETPGHSPDTPASHQSLTGYPSLSTQVLGNSIARIDTRPPPGATELTRPSPPSRKGRNLKNLAVDTSTAFPLGRAISTASLPLQHLQSDPKMSTYLSPATPGFVRPATATRRKGNGLGLMIQTQANIPEDGAVPPTPSLVRPASLRHYQSSPSLNLFSAKYGPDGGMKLPPLTTARRNVAVGFADAPVFEQNEDEEQQNFDVPQSREEKPESYPDGPICIYDPHVYLYYEPSAEQASRYDVIFNVASEVKNPFYGHAKDLEASERDSQPNLRRRASSPSTPKASDLSRISSLPEYIHIPWEHNTDIVPDLYRLVKVIDERVQQGKRVLIHCQCGVSRSASLIVAYGIYKNPSITVQEAYDAVKRRSKWIGPNMNLIMQLQEFRSGLLRADAGVMKPISKASLVRPSFHRSQSAQGEQFVKTHSRMPKSAPLAPEDLPPVPHQIMTAHPTGQQFVLPGPSSAPSGLTWPSGEDQSRAQAYQEERHASQPNTALPQVQQSLQSPRIPTRIEPPPRLEVQLPSAAGEASPNGGLFSPRGAEFNMTSTLPPTFDDGFGLTSPRNTTFTGLSASPDIQRLQSLHQPFQSVQPLRPLQTQQTQQTHPIQHTRFDSSTMSPRTTEFHMTPFNPRPRAGPGAAATADETFGLTSPRDATFTHLPLRPKSTPPQEARVKPILPTVPQDPAASLRESQARADLGSKVGLTRRSNYDLRAAFHSGTTGVPEIPIPVRLHTPKLDALTHHSADVAGPQAPASDELMSPREAAFAGNPFHEPPAAADADANANVCSGAGASARPDKKADPRSPPQKGTSTIIRSIFDVL